MDEYFKKTTGVTMRTKLPDIRVSLNAKKLAKSEKKIVYSDLITLARLKDGVSIQEIFLI